MNLSAGDVVKNARKCISCYIRDNICDDYTINMLHAHLDLLITVAESKGTTTYLCEDDMIYSCENALDGCTQHRVLFGFTDIYKMNEPDITHINIGGIWHNVDDEFQLKKDFFGIFSDVKFMINRTHHLVHARYEESFDYNMVDDNDVVYETYCYIADKSNWEDIMATTFASICKLTGN